MRQIKNLAFGACLLLVLGLSGCGFGFHVYLQDGYTLWSSYPGDAAIQHETNIEFSIPSEITKISMVKGYIFGYVEVPNVTGLEGLPKEMKGHVASLIESSSPGYFFINTRTHFYKKGLSKEAWLKLLAENGFKKAPRLKSLRAFRIWRYFLGRYE